MIMEHKISIPSDMGLLNMIKEKSVQGVEEKKSRIDIMKEAGRELEPFVQALTSHLNKRCL
jgi:hypothetical protein